MKTFGLVQQSQDRTWSDQARGVTPPNSLTEEPPRTRSVNILSYPTLRGGLRGAADLRQGIKEVVPNLRYYVFAADTDTFTNTMVF